MLRYYQAGQLFLLISLTYVYHYVVGVDSKRKLLASYLLVDQ